MVRKVIFHVDETALWGRALANIGNLIRYYEETKEQYEIELLVNGSAVELFAAEKAAEAGLSEEIKEASRKGVYMAACGNALHNLNISRDSLFDFVTVIQAGVAELAAKQAQGFAYIKP